MCAKCPICYSTRLNINPRKRSYLCDSCGAEGPLYDVITKQQEEIESANSKVAG